MLLEAAAGRSPHSMRRLLPQAAAIVLLASTASCGADRPDFYVAGVGVVVQTDAPFSRHPDFAGRIGSAVSAALAYWGGSWEDLRGSRITFLEGPYVPCSAREGAVGCYDGQFRISASDPGAGTFECVEQTVLVHEIGHAVIGDPLHTDPRWMEFDSVLAALAGRSGYTADGETACDIALSVWRHPPDTR